MLGATCRRGYSTKFRGLFAWGRGKEEIGGVRSEGRPQLAKRSTCMLVSGTFKLKDVVDVPEFLNGLFGG